MYIRQPCLIQPPTSNEARPREGSGRGRFLPGGKNASFQRGHTGFHYLISINSLSVCLACLPVLSVCLCALFRITIDCESCTRPAITNPGSMEAGWPGLTRWTCSVASRLELAKVAVILQFCRRALKSRRDFVCLRFSYFFTPSAHTTSYAACMCQTALPHFHLC